MSKYFNEKEKQELGQKLNGLSPEIKRFAIKMAIRIKQGARHSIFESVNLDKIAENYFGRFAPPRAEGMTDEQYRNCLVRKFWEWHGFSGVWHAPEEKEEKGRLALIDFGGSYGLWSDYAGSEDTSYFYKIVKRWCYLDELIACEEKLKKAEGTIRLLKTAVDFDPDLVKVCDDWLNS